MVRKASEANGAVAAALQATRESRRLEFKDTFAPGAPGEWCELIKDIVAIANSGGGVIVLGVDAAGRPTGWGSSSLLDLDPACVAEQVATYVGEKWGELEIAPAVKNGQSVATIVVAPRTGSPLIFEKPGVYVDDGKETTAFARGSVYFRHGAKSEPGTAKDLARFTATETTRTRRELLKNLRKVVRAPDGAEVILVAPKAGPAGTVERFRVVDDPGAPAVARTDFDVTHPYRQTELVKALNERAGERIVGPYEIQCVRRVYAIDTRPEFFHRPKFGSPQYSDAFVSWLITEYQRDRDFFANAKAADQAARHPEV
jgi:hypothetical protein